MSPLIWQRRGRGREGTVGKGDRERRGHGQSPASVETVRGLLLDSGRGPGRDTTAWGGPGRHRARGVSRTDRGLTCRHQAPKQSAGRLAGRNQDVHSPGQGRARLGGQGPAVGPPMKAGLWGCSDPDPKLSWSEPQSSPPSPPPYAYSSCPLPRAAAPSTHGQGENITPSDGPPSTEIPPSLRSSLGLCHRSALQLGRVADLA